MTAHARAALLLLVAAAAAPLVHFQPEPFPHVSHQGLFPLCEGCHEGIVSGQAADLYPGAESCTSCHDGEREDRVDWTGPSHRVSNLAFDHRTHALRVEQEGDSANCRSCHADGDERMAVAAATAESCTACHAHAAPAHLDESRECSVCHVPLVAATDLDTERVSGFEKPAGHEAADFPVSHGANAASSTCAVCHARESCTRCHLNDADVPEIVTLRHDPRVAGIVADLAPEYPTPSSHDGDWDVLHGATAEGDIAGCANCHARDSCRSCHAQRSAAAIEALPRRPAGDARGVTLSRDAWEVHPPGFDRRHGSEAATAEGTCASCHAIETCSECHASAGTPVFHMPNFLATHGPTAYAAEAECTSCHNREVFCRSCHDRIGLGAADRLGVAFHTANPFWIVGHGMAARQGIENCATCHAQTSCMRCHSALGGWRVSPHPEGWNGSRAEQANPLNCRLCHRRGVGP